MNQSYWQQIKTKKFTSLDKDLDTDILIIGAGISGISLAYYLRNCGKRIVVVDSDEIASHTSSHTTAKLSSLHGLIYYDLVQSYDIHCAYLYYKSNEQALKSIKRIIEEEKIDCDFIENKAFIYTNNEKDVYKLQQQEAILKAFQLKVFHDSSYLYSIGLDHQAIFHPLKYINALVSICEKEGVSFYTHSQVTKIKREQPFKVKVNNHIIKCHYVVHATRYPFIKKGLYFLKLFQQSESIDIKQHCDSDDSYLQIGKSKSYRPLFDKKSLMIYPDASSWFAQDSISLRGIPYIGEYKNKEYIIYGFGKWGMTLSHVAAKLISDLILEKENPYEELYGCHYFSIDFFKKYKKQVLCNNKRGYYDLRFHVLSIDEIEKNNGGLVRVNGKLKAVYKDDKGKCYFMSPYCPHLKGIVEFDKKHLVFRCPCHQSVYDRYGKVIEGPSLIDIKE